MHDDQLRDLLRTIEDDREPDPAFAEALFVRLDSVRRGAGPRRTHVVLLVAALLVASTAAAFAFGSGILRLPLTVEATPRPSSSGIAEASPAPSDPASSPADPSVAPSARADPALEGAVLFAEADGIRLRANASNSGEVIATLRRGQLMGATGASASANGMNWYEVRIGPGQLAGWVAAGPDSTWLRLVEDGAVTFACGGGPCGEQSSIVSVTPFGEDIQTIAPATELTEWRWSPDGSRLVASRGGTTLPYRIVVLEPDGTQSLDLGIGSAARWSPDGTRLAWLGDGGTVVTDADLDPGPPARGMTTGVPLWSPDGMLFAFTASESEGAIDAPASIYVAPVDGGEPMRLTDAGYPGSLAWAPDGSGVATTFVDLSGQDPARAFFVPVDGGDLEELFDGAVANSPPAWSPDGTRLAMSTSEGLVVGDGLGRDATTLVTLGAGEFLGEVTWSPSGAWIQFTRSEGFEPTMFVVRADGSEVPRQISPDGTGAQQAEWQPLLVPLP